MNYIHYSFTVNPPQPGSEILIALLSETEFESFSLTETGFDAYVTTINDDESFIQALEFTDFQFEYTKQEIQQQNWNEEWEKNFSPVYVEDICCIRAPFHESPSLVKHDIVIMPKMSFGTGHHDTTWSMCKAMASYNFNDKNVLDMGCGTGVLAILAKKLGANNVLGIDIDDWSVENARENCDTNGCEDIVVLKGDATLLLGKDNLYHIILANINKNVLKSDMGQYFNSLLSKGYLFLSGFFTTDVQELTTLAEIIGFSFVTTCDKNGWAVIVLQKQ